MDRPESKIDNTTASLMVGTALFFDLLSIVPIVSWLVAFFAYMTFALWFMIRGIGFISPKKLAAPVVSIIIEVIPAISALPSITLMILISIAIIRTEEKTGIDIGKAAVKNPGVVNKARNKTAGRDNPDIITPSRKRVEKERAQTRELREKTA